jgi:hypothetical protein
MFKTVRSLEACAWTHVAIGISLLSFVQGGLLAQIGGVPDGYAAWAGREQLHSGVAVAADERASRERWVPQMNAEWGAGSKRPRASPPCLYW